MENSKQAATEYVTVDRFERAMDKLAGAVKVGFDEVHQRFDGVDREIAELKGDVKALKSDVLSVQGDVRRIDNRLARQQEMIDENRTGLRTLRVHVGLGAE